MSSADRFSPMVMMIVILRRLAPAPRQPRRSRLEVLVRGRLPQVRRCRGRQSVLKSSEHVRRRGGRRATLALFLQRPRQASHVGAAAAAPSDSRRIDQGMAIVHCPHHVPAAWFAGQRPAGGGGVRGQSTLLALHPFPIGGSDQHVIATGPSRARAANLLLRHLRETQAVEALLSQAGVDGNPRHCLLPLRLLLHLLLLRLLLGRPDTSRKTLCLPISCVIALPQSQTVLFSISRRLRS